MGRNCTTSAGWLTGLFGIAALCIAQPATTGLIATDAGHDRIVEFTVWPNQPTVLWEGPPLNEPTGMFRRYDAVRGWEYFVCNAGDGSIVAIDSVFQSHRTIIEAGVSTMVSPSDLRSFDEIPGVLYVLDKHDGAVHRFDEVAGTFIDIIVAPLAPASSMTLMWTPNPVNDPIVVIAYPTLGKVNRYDARSGALMNTVASVEGAAWVERDDYGHVGVLEDVADPTVNDRVRWYTQAGVPNGTVRTITSGLAPNDLHYSRYGSGWYLLFDDRLEALWTGTSITGDPGSQFDSLIRFKQCYANCDPSGEPAPLDVFDFLCFQQSFVKGESYACDCDTSTGSGVCDIFDFLCYQNAFIMGCP